MDDNRFITITNDNGEEQELEVLFTYHSDEFNKDYVVFIIEEDGEESVTAACYVENDDEASGEIVDIETDAEWEMIEALVDDYNNSIGEEDEEEDEE